MVAFRSSKWDLTRGMMNLNQLSFEFLQDYINIYMASTRINSPSQEVKNKIDTTQKTPPKTRFWSFLFTYSYLTCCGSFISVLKKIFFFNFHGFFLRFFRDFFTKMKNSQFIDQKNPWKMKKNIFFKTDMKLWQHVR